MIKCVFLISYKPCNHNITVNKVFANKFFIAVCFLIIFELDIKFYLNSYENCLAFFIFI